jgi:hypothetical protein
MRKVDTYQIATAGCWLRITIPMVTRTLGLLLAGLVGALAHPQHTFAGENFPQTTIVKVKAYHPHGKVTRGSAVLLGAERLVTNCHVTAASHSLSVVHNGRVWRAELDAQDTVRDLCILRVPGIAGTVANTSKSLTAGQKVFATGFFAGNQLVVTEGHIVALHDYDGAKVIQVSSPFETGASGGGLFDEQGQLIGILTFKARTGGAFHFALPAEWVNHWDRPGSERNAVAKPAFWQRPAENQPFFLRAMTLEVNQNWIALAALGENWTKDNPTNPQAWTTLETAFRNLKRMDDATWARGKAQQLGFVPARQDLVTLDLHEYGDLDSAP